MPGRAAVCRLEDATIRAPERSTLDEALLLLPERRVDSVRIARIELHVVGAGVFVLVENFLKRAAAVCRPKDAALLVRPVRMAEGGDEEPAGVARVDGDHRDHLGVVEAEVRPRLAGVGRLVHAVADGEIGSDNPGAAADVDDVRIGRRHRDRADRARVLAVEEWVPRRAIVGRPPDAAVVETDIGDVRLTRHAGDGAGATGARGADGAPVHSRVDFGGLRASGGRYGDEAEESKSAHESPLEE